MQRWLVDDPIREILNREEIRFDHAGALTTLANVQAIVAAARSRPHATSGAVFQHLVGAKLEVRFPEMTIENHGATTADSVTGRTGDFQIADTVLHVTAIPGPPLIAKCRQNLADELRPAIVTPDDKVLQATALLDAEMLVQRVDIFGLERFIAQNLDEIAAFDTRARRSGLRALLQAYNRRVSEVETDRSLRIRIPAGL